MQINVIELDFPFFMKFRLFVRMLAQRRVHVDARNILDVMIILILYYLQVCQF